MISNFFIRIGAAALMAVCAGVYTYAEVQTARIPAGTFTRGSSDGKEDERPVKEIEMSAFSMMTKEVTEAQYQKCVDAGRCSPAHYEDGRCLQWTGSDFVNVTVPKQFRGSNLPVVCVSWQQAREYCASP